MPTRSSTARLSFTWDLQRGDGLSGARIEAYELSERIRKEGYNITVDPLRGY